MNALTERQQAAWPEAIARLKKTGAILPANIRDWDVSYSDETRTGRGHLINATYLDGEIFAQIVMDVYGYPTVSWATLDWIHADANEECDCGTCVEELGEPA